MRSAGRVSTAWRSEIARHHLEGGQRGAGGGARALEQRHRRGQRRHGGQRGHLRRRQRVQLQRRGGDDAEGAFGADEQVLEVVAGVVLAQAAQAVPDLAAGQHDLEAQRQVARVAVAQHLRAAGIGGRLPPIVALPSAARLSGNRRPAASAASAPPAARSRPRR
jgi:hypothetical protein